MQRITRRDFIKITVTTGAASAVLAGCQSPRRWVVLEPYVRPPEEQLAGQATWYASTCRQCPAGCGIVVRIMNGRAVKIEGNPEHPINRGKLCARGQAGLQLLYNPDRLAGPMQQAQRGSAKFDSLTWDDGVHLLQSKLTSAGNRVAVWGGSTMSGHLIDLFTRLTSAIGAQPPLLYDLYSTYHGYTLLRSSSQSLFGVPTLPTYDIGNADIVFSFGADFLGTGLSSTRYGIEYGNMRGQPLGKRGYMVQFEPRMSSTGAKADQWVPLRPGSEGLVAQAIMRLVADLGTGDQDRVMRAKTLAGNVDPRQAATESDVSIDSLTRLARIFASNTRTVAIPGGQLLGYDNAVSTVNAIHSLNLVAGRFNQVGGVFLTPEPNQPNITTANMATYSDAQKLIGQMQDGKIDVLMLHSANPVYELPEQSGFLKALQKVPFVVSFAPMIDDTAVWANLVLPDHTYLESWGYRVSNPAFGVPVISAQQPVVTPYFESRATADVLLTVAKGIPAARDALHWDDEVAYLRDVVGKLPAGAYGGTNADVRWARFLQHGNWNAGTQTTTTVTLPSVSQPVQISTAKFQGEAAAYPYFLHLSMSPLLGDGNGANLPWLQGSPDPMTTIQWQTWVELNPVTAQGLGLKNGDIVKVTSPYGEIEAPIYIYPAIRPDTISIPLGQGHTGSGRYASGRGSNALQLVGGQTDTTGSHLAWANVRVKVTPTGRSVALATFESSIGVTEGFINRAFPGQ